MQCNTVPSLSLSFRTLLSGGMNHDSGDACLRILVPSSLFDGFIHHIATLTDSAANERTDGSVHADVCLFCSLFGDYFRNIAGDTLAEFPQRSFVRICLSSTLQRGPQDTPGT
jgi:hypothetical protein